MSGEAKVISTGPLPASEAVWTKLVKKTYKDPNGVTRTWESAERTTRPKGSDIDGVGIVAILEKETDPGFCNTNLRMVHVTVDMSLPANQDLKPELEENEFIEVFLVKLVDLWEECIKLEAQGYAIDARIANLAEGIEIGQEVQALGAG
ncbi:hypothetical protein CHGG_06156 [Chaetomium globosum CBS 148.51]|uniref:Uncharacterized protein n=1 Tax=Chaetomium globosum (strain ATCC 6205 / CBS 148.51 / DSM 1962 / NBRC 6347 / NRRL 1970) TaxID=306901 RepID=Q2H5A9_CHAGB|nr:uncharacterized protein CHGG_06156 [Chaetomium globosum CBS 148.51]EAQ89537.1 hypothetical protein CHGG_06156 [Chaetomium globosum CBS 148.51]